MRRILVTGGAGFLGLHLCRRFVNEGHKVVAIDSMTSGKQWRVDELTKLGVLFIRHDVTQPYDVGPVDYIFNMACAASPPAYQADPVHTMLTCVLGAKHAADMAAKYHATLFQASTSEVYGDPKTHPQDEEYRGNVSLAGPRACYDEGKRAAETLLTDMAASGAFDLRIGRIFNTYGPGMSLDDGRVVSNFVMQALAGKPLTVYGFGMQTRSFCYVDDLIEGIVMLAESDVTGPVNLGNDSEVSIMDLARQLSALFCQPLNIEHQPMPVHDPQVRQPDLTRAIEMLHWSPQTELDYGLTATVDDFEQRLYTQSKGETDAV